MLHLLNFGANKAAYVTKREDKLTGSGYMSKLDSM